MQKSFHVHNLDFIDLEKTGEFSVFLVSFYMNVKLGVYPKIMYKIKECHLHSEERWFSLR